MTAFVVIYPTFFVESVDASGLEGTPGLDSEGYYVIENDAFKINSDGGDAIVTTAGINRAIEWAKSQGYGKIRFEEGVYAVYNDTNNLYLTPHGGIIIPSDTEVDLNGASFVLEANFYGTYSVFGVAFAENVVIKNGKIYGDKNEHIYLFNYSAPLSNKGVGIWIAASKNVLVQDVEVYDTIGDGILADDDGIIKSKGGTASQNIRVADCVIKNAGRYGINFEAVVDGEISGNTVDGVKGVWTGYGIRVGTGVKEYKLNASTYTAKNIKVLSNNIVNAKGGSILCDFVENVEIRENVMINGGMAMLGAKNATVTLNQLINSTIRVRGKYSTPTFGVNALDEHSMIIYDGRN
ncbi:MAG: right-handed parallel beta-helix repeat-containing protein [Clostridiales bacterium]|jgi:hypothetical protein|nr:right-handed parallel beta-helix repeat-containing protein [Clostridiales bacterium]